MRGKQDKQGRLQPIQEPPDSSDNDISDEELVADVDKLSFLARLPGAALADGSSIDSARGERRIKGLNKAKHADDVELKEVEAWEARPRSMLVSSPSQVKPSPLPVKSLDGEIIIPRRSTTSASYPGQGGPTDAVVTAMHVEGVTVQDDLQIMKEQLQKNKEKQELERKRREESQSNLEFEKGILHDGKDKTKEAGILKALNECVSTDQRQRKAKELMAAAAQSLLANPEEQMAPQMRVLMVLLQEKDHATARLAMLSLLAVFKDIIPGYRIKSQEDRERELNGAPISKEVRTLWTYENAMLKYYQQYLRHIKGIIKDWRSGKFPKAHARVAARCLGTLIKVAAHFNYAGDILQTLVLNMTSKDEVIRSHCCEAISSLLMNSMQGGAEGFGQLALDAVQLVADLVKRRNCVTPPEVVECLLKLEFVDILSGEDFELAKAARKKFRRKKRRENKDEVNRAFREAQAMVDKDTRRYHQSATLEALFEIFFRVLKTATGSNLIARDKQNSNAQISASKCARKFPLLPATLDGLAKYCHLISIDYFQDLMTVLEQLIGSEALPPSIQMRCLLTAATILRGQGEALTIDRRGFYIDLYAAIFNAVLEPLNEMVLEDGDEAVDEQDASQTSNGAKRKSPSENLGWLVARLLEMMVLDSKLLDVVRQSAFAKRIASTAAQAGDSGTAMSFLCVLQRMLKRDLKLRNMLENEEGGPVASKAYNPDINDPAEVGAMAVPLWELALLASHYHPHVSQFAMDISTLNLGHRQGSSFGHFAGSVLPLSASPLDFISRYTTAHGGFCPAPKVLQRQQTRKEVNKRKNRLGGDDMETNFIQQVEELLEQSHVLPPNCGAHEVMVTGEEENKIAIGKTLRRHFQIQTEFELNAALRREHALMTKKLQLFHQHLQKK